MYKRFGGGVLAIVMESGGTTGAIDEGLCASILESMHQRVARLEDVWKVKLTMNDVKEEFDLFAAKGCKAKSSLNTLFFGVQKATNGVVGEIWVNRRLGMDDTFNAVTITEEVMARDSSNGEKCLLIVCRGTFNNTKVILKFRLVEAISEHATEKETSNALMVQSDKNLDGLFPKLYGVFKVKTEGPLGNKLTWECIMTGPLIELDRSDRVSCIRQRECVRLLGKLHRCGYVHGDPHFGNFMKNSAGKAYMIDQDEIRRLPEDERNNGIITRATNNDVSKYMQILDYHQFLFWNNKNCLALNYMDAVGGSGYEIELAWRSLWMKTGYFSLILTPFSIMSPKKRSVEEIKMFLQSSSVILDGKGSFLTFLKEKTVQNIDSRIESFVALKNDMKRINDSLLESWNQKITHKPIKFDNDGNLLKNGKPIDLNGKPIVYHV